MTLRADFTSQDYFRNPAAGIERLRTAGSVVEVRFPIVGKVWITTTQDLAARVLKESETLTLRKDGGAIAGLRFDPMCNRGGSHSWGFLLLVGAGVATLIGLAGMGLAYLIVSIALLAGVSISRDWLLVIVVLALGGAALAKLFLAGRRR